MAMTGRVAGRQGARRSAEGRLGHLVVAALVVGGLLVACSSGGGSSGAFCSLARRDAADRELKNADVNDAASAQKVRDALQALADRAPGAIRSDIETVASALKKVTEGDVAALSDPAESVKIKAASDRLTKYFRDTCGIKSG